MGKKERIISNILKVVWVIVILNDLFFVKNANKTVIDSIFLIVIYVIGYARNHQRRR